VQSVAKVFRAEIPGDIGVFGELKIETVTVPVNVVADHLVAIAFPGMYAVA
jgi:hypothetical protein